MDRMFLLLEVPVLYVLTGGYNGLQSLSPS